VGAVNIGTGKETDVVTLCSLLREGVGSAVTPIHGPPKPGEQRRSCLEASLAQQVWGWRPKVDLKEGLEETIAYYREAGSA
jgi:UDP-glucose 4-epimerase